MIYYFFFSSRRRHTRYWRDWSSDVCSSDLFQSGHGKTVLAECTLTEETVRRVLRTTVDDLLALSFAGTHGAVASGMQSVAFTPASAIAAIFADRKSVV